MWTQTIFILNILIEVLLIFAIWKVSKRKRTMQQFVMRNVEISKEIKGYLDKIHINCKIAEKMAERAFNMASSSTLGVVALQKSLQVPKLATKQQVQRNQLAKNEIDKLFTTVGTFDYLRPILSDEENDLLDKMEAEKLKNGEAV